MTWTLESGSHVLRNGGMSKNSKDDCASRKNNYTHQILYDHLLYDHLSLAERARLSKFTNPLFLGNPERSFDAHRFRRFPYTFANRRIVSDVHSPPTRLFSGIAKHARSFDSSTH